MLWFVYNVLFTIAYVVMLPRFLFRMWRRGGYRYRFMQRFGRYDAETLARLRDGGRIWVHAVSVGEVHVALRFIEALRRRHPGQRFILTTTTSTGHGVAETRLGPEDVLLYFPADFPLIVNRALRILQPRAILLTECELWPNLIRLATGRGIPVFLINGRISASSARGYRLLRVFFSRVVRAFTILFVQGEIERQSLAALGADPAKIVVAGSAKYDIAVAAATDPAPVGDYLAGLGMGPGTRLLLGGSTWPGEEAVLLDLYTRLRGRMPDLRLVLVPRHAERRAEIEAEIRRRELSFAKRSDAAAGPAAAAPDVLLVDTTGELCDFYAHATLIFVGKTLTDHGGQNIIEPAHFGKPIVVGPNMENFQVICRDFLKAGALVQVPGREALERGIERLLGDADACEALGKAALALVKQRQGVVDANASAIWSALAAAHPDRGNQ